ncbi:hypothetical protein LTR66_000914 [Elasticomyces elasticus]|nr:hypothetical protein LTR66_000914 [Elasticomyces elasticus]
MLNEDVFAGKLKNMVVLNWAPIGTSTAGVTFVPGKKAKRVAIYLNKSNRPSRDEVIAGLLHQMIHAYFLVCCGAQDKDDLVDGRLKDELHFGVLLFQIHTLSALRGQQALPFDFHHERLNRETGYYPYDPSGSYGTIKSWLDEEYKKALDQALDKNGDYVCRLDEDGPNPIHRLMAAGPSAAYVELIWDEQRVMISREKVHKYSTLKKQFADGKRSMKIPDCKLQIFQCLHSFIVDGEYKPDLGRVKKTGDPSACGPPAIRDLREDEPEFLLTDIKLFKLGEAMSFGELREYALERMKEQHFTYNNPIAALAEIYNNGDIAKPVHNDLRKWTTEFLMKTTVYHARHHYVEVLESNYDRLQRPDYYDKFLDFHHLSELFRQDCHRAIEQMHTREPVQALPSRSTSVRLPTPPRMLQQHARPRRASLTYGVPYPASPPNAIAQLPVYASTPPWTQSPVRARLASPYPTYGASPPDWRPIRAVHHEPVFEDTLGERVLDGIDVVSDGWSDLSGDPYFGVLGR